MYLLPAALDQHMMILQLIYSKGFGIKYGYHKEAFKILESIMEKKNLMMVEKKWLRCQQLQN